MVRAILAGKKTQTRRVVKPKASESSMASFSAASGWYPDRYNHGREWCMWGVRGTTDHNKQGAWLGRCPYGDVGDRLWVREMWADGDELASSRGPLDAPEHVLYRADKSAYYFGDSPMDGSNLPGRRVKDTEGWNFDHPCVHWKPSIHMPRWAARIILDVTDVRVERVQAITEEDAKAEGVESLGPSIGAEQGFVDDSGRTHGTHPYTLAFACLWDEINADRGFPWRNNPWVWVVSFKRVVYSARVAS